MFSTRTESLHLHGFGSHDAPLSMRDLRGARADALSRYCNGSGDDSASAESSAAGSRVRATAIFGGANPWPPASLPERVPSMRRNRDGAWSAYSDAWRNTHSVPAGSLGHDRHYESITIAVPLFPYRYGLFPGKRLYVEFDRAGVGRCRTGCRKPADIWLGKSLQSVRDCHRSGFVRWTAGAMSMQAGRGRASALWTGCAGTSLGKCWINPSRISWRLEPIPQVRC
ncbi:MAG: hypothetical protein H6R26_771 [Proteobacteria bacterium]|nr:hypothetical protein [Pseudomonadota bacterium]